LWRKWSHILDQDGRDSHSGAKPDSESGSQSLAKSNTIAFANSDPGADAFTNSIALA
jgi:hypothetical protein